MLPKQEGSLEAQPLHERGERTPTLADETPQPCTIQHPLLLAYSNIIRLPRDRAQLEQNCGLSHCTIRQHKHLKPPRIP